MLGTPGAVSPPVVEAPSTRPLPLPGFVPVLAPVVPVGRGDPTAVPPPPYEPTGGPLPGAADVPLVPDDDPDEVAEEETVPVSDPPDDVATVPVSDPLLLFIVEEVAIVGEVEEEPVVVVDVLLEVLEALT